MGGLGDIDAGGKRTGRTRNKAMGFGDLDSMGSGYDIEGCDCHGCNGWN